MTGDEYQASIAALVDEAPPLSSEQLSRLRTLFDNGEDRNVRE
jgi:hypothetical protein